MSEFCICSPRDILVEALAWDIHKTSRVTGSEKEEKLSAPRVSKYTESAESSVKRQNSKNIERDEMAKSSRTSYFVARAVQSWVPSLNHLLNHSRNQCVNLNVFHIFIRAFHNGNPYSAERGFNHVAEHHRWPLRFTTRTTLFTAYNIILMRVHPKLLHVFFLLRE